MSFSSDQPMSTLLVPSKGQIVQSSPLRRRLGIGLGARFVEQEELDSLKLRVVRPVASVHSSNLAGMVKAASHGVPCRLEDFDLAALLIQTQVSALRVQRAGRN